MSEKGSCAHTVVHWTQCVAANGLTTDRWACPLCGTEFVSRAQLDEARAELAKIHNAVEEQYAITHRISCERNHAERCHADTAVIAQERYIENERYKKALEHIRSMPWRSDKPYDLMDAVAYAYAALEGDENE